MRCASGLTDSAAVANAFADIMARARSFNAGARVDGVLVQEMVTNGTEVIVGINVDPQLGPMLLLGIGGVLVEVFKMSACDGVRSHLTKRTR